VCGVARNWPASLGAEAWLGDGVPHPHQLLLLLLLRGQCL